MLTSGIYKAVPKKYDVSVTKYNRIVLERKLRELKGEIQFPRLVKKGTFQNNPRLIK